MNVCILDKHVFIPMMISKLSLVSLAAYILHLLHSNNFFPTLPDTGLLLFYFSFLSFFLLWSNIQQEEIGGRKGLYGLTVQRYTVHQGKTAWWQECWSACHFISFLRNMGGRLKDRREEKWKEKGGGEKKVKGRGRQK